MRHDSAFFGHFNVCSMWQMTLRNSGMCFAEKAISTCRTLIHAASVRTRWPSHNTLPDKSPTNGCR